MKWDKLTKKQKTYVMVTGVFTAVLLWAFISAAVITHNLNRDNLQTDKDAQEALIHGIILTETKNEKKYWEIYGENGRYDSKNHVASLHNLVGNIYDGDEITMSFESARGAYDSKKKQITLYEETFIVLKDGVTLSANELVWSGSENPIIARNNVRVTRGGDFLATADAIEISPDYSKIKISGNSNSNIYKGRAQPGSGK